MNNTRVPSVTRVRAFLTSDGVRVKWDNVSYLTIDKKEDYWEVAIKWKFRAGIREKIVTLTNDVIPSKYFKQFNFAPLTQTLFINMARVLFIEEETIHGPQIYIKVTMVFVDGLSLTEKIPAESWQGWKANYA